ncbi:hypothetical protein BCR44DRAFT_44352 [Catenaria anguillulae PL171]|uniref:Uncharacterized protein n=1 Tax=Catenaria anguillulae PL171 TaxID=765915 RepID=A0A1Y2HXX6_9FUNG|nr:hypothetical protein BCR44DRAFT_44352 [Catenaria anguillulae PL171]
MTPPTVSTSTKSPVLVILPPTHKCPDLTRVLKLARKAFDDVTLDILDLNLRFAWVSGDELEKDGPQAPPASAALRSVQAPPAALSPTVIEPVPAHSNALTYIGSIPPASVAQPRVLISDFVPTLSDAEILSACRNGADIAGATFYPPLPLGPGQSSVRSVLLAFSKLKRAKLHVQWIKQAAGAGLLAGKLVTHVVSANAIPRHASPDTLIRHKTAAASTSDSTLPFSPDPASLSSVPPAANVPTILSDALIPASAWHFNVNNLFGSLKDADILASIVPQGIPLIGASLSPPKRRSKKRPELVRAVSLYFKSEVHANLCLLWIRHHSKIPTGPVAKLRNPEADISMNLSWKGLYKTAKPKHPTRLVATSTLSSKPQATVASFSPQLTVASLTPIITQLPTLYRLTIGNLLDHLTEDQLRTTLVPPGVIPVSFQLLPLRPLVVCPVMAGTVQLDLASERDLNLTHDWIKAEAVVGGRVAQLLVPNSEISVHILKLTAPPAPTALTSPSSTPENPSTPALPAQPAGPAPSPLDVLPEASPEHYRLHVSNLKPGLELAQIIPALVPHNIKLAGATLFEPRPMGGSRRVLVRSLKFAFFTESDAKQCQQWIKKDLDGGVSRLVLPGAKLVVGNPMDPMVSNVPESHHDDLGMNGNPDVFQPTAPAGPSRLRSPSATSVASSTTTATSMAGELSTSHSSLQQLTQHKQFRISLTGIDPSLPVSTVFSTILGSLEGAAAEPARVGVRSANGHRGAEFVFDSEATAKQFALQVWNGIRKGMYTGLTAVGEELTIERKV